jgi:hypothetical protein
VGYALGLVERRARDRDRVAIPPIERAIAPLARHEDLRLEICTSGRTFSSARCAYEHRDTEHFSLDDFSAGGDRLSRAAAERRPRGPPEASQSDLTFTIEKIVGRAKNLSPRSLPGGFEIRG